MMYRLILAAVLLLCPVVARADTPMTMTQLQNLFRDGQANGSITPLDMRNVIVSMLNNQANLGDLTSVSAAQTNLGLGSAALVNTGTSGSLIPLLSGTNTWSGSQIFTGLNGWSPAFILTPNGSSITAGGTGNAVGDVLTLADGCTPHAALTVSAVSSGSVTAYNVTTQGSCATLPSNPVAVGSTSGTGAGATFTLAWVPSVGGGSLILGTLANNNGNSYVGAEQSPYFLGTESTFVGDRAGGAVASGNFNWIAGHDAFGLGGGCTSIYAGAVTVTGADALRNTCGSGQVDVYGNGALKSYNQTGTSGNNYLTGTATFGAGSLSNWNAAVANPYNTAFGNGSCAGASSGTVSFSGIACFGPRVGHVLTTATNSLIISGGGTGFAGAAGATFASGSSVILISSGTANIDTPAAGTTHFINMENTYIASTAAPSYVSGFGTNAGWNGSGATSQHFQWKVGTGGTASTGVFSFPTAAPNGWYCTGRDYTTPASYVEDFAPTSTTTVTVTNYSRTTGSAVAWTSGDFLDVSCAGY
jgi:hypothetical protein